MPHDHADHHSQKFISKQRTARRYGKNDRTIARWARDPKLDFPQPVMINGRWYFEEAKLDEFDRRLTTARMRDMARRHQAEDAVKHAQCDPPRSQHAAVKVKDASSTGGEA